MLELKWRRIARRDPDAIVENISDDNIDAAEALREEPVFHLQNFMPGIWTLTALSWISHITYRFLLKK